MEKFYLEVPSLKRKDDAIKFIQEFIAIKSPIHGCGQLQYYLDKYEMWLNKLVRDKNDINYTFNVPTDTYFLIRESDDKIVGMINLRLKLTEDLKIAAGHIGYCIRPCERGKGYNKINLYLGLKKLLEYGIEEAYLFCDTDNVPSRKTILDFGGLFQRTYTWPDRIDEKYIIPVREAIEKNKTYEAYLIS